MSILRETLFGALLCGMCAAAIAANEQEQPDAALLEFLGTWDDDDDWELFVDIASDSPDFDDDGEVGRSANRDAGPDYE